MKLSFTELFAPIYQYIAHPILQRLTAMSQQVTDLTTAVSNLTSAVSAATANEVALKQKLDAALAANIDLTAQLAAAQGGQADPADAAAIVASTASILSATQALSDATAANAPSN